MCINLLFKVQRVQIFIDLPTRSNTNLFIFSITDKKADVFSCSWGDIPIDLQCNGINNCGDNSDEEDCISFFGALASDTPQENMDYPQNFAADKMVSIVKPNEKIPSYK